jgi:hypothetical protein
MRKMTDLFFAYSPWVITAFRYENVLIQPWVQGFKYNPTQQHPWEYLDIDYAARARAPR